MSTMTVDEKRPAKEKKGGFLHEVLEIGKTIVFALLIAFVLRVLLFQPFTIPSASMEPTLLEGDYIIVSKWPYGYSRHSLALPWSPPVGGAGRILGGSIDRGDIVVFKLPRDDRTDYIKRVIGLPGDRIQVREGRVYINNVAVGRGRLSPEQIQTAFSGQREVLRWRETLPGPGGATFTTYDYGPEGELDNTGVYVVPAGHYFMMGDSRDNSIDSRVPEQYGVGFVPAENIVGRADIILFSWEPGASLLKPWTWVRLRPSRFFTLL